ncbi:GIY-YIG nuclease family protein [Bosea sp. 2KB_26]|uniref:GIY-YIG nuclease family protein n=1 Tax=Bosea sp. 2KB_26 TaxID=3237475 RepID=UPI003F8F0C5B
MAGATGRWIVKSEDRKAAVAAYKLRKAVPGIYVVACATTGQQWAGSAPDLGTIWNRLSFTLRQGANTHRSLQSAWRDHGAESFSFEVVERVDLETLPYVLDRFLRDRLAHWCKTLQVEPI